MVKLRGNRLSMIFQDAGAALNPSLYRRSSADRTLRRTLGLNRAEAHRRAVDLFSQVGINDAERACRPFRISFRAGCSSG